METKYYLYIKTSPLGLKYLGKTTKDPFTYIGSGKIWKRHINKYKLSYNDIKTEIVFETNNLDDLIRKGIELSNLYNIVESKEWANLRVEAGDGGDTSKSIDYSNHNFHKSNRSKHLNVWLDGVTIDERKKILRERISNVDFVDRAKKSKENTDWESWKISIKNRKINYVKFLSNVHKNNKKPILQSDIYGNPIREFNSATDAAKELNVKVGNISQCLTGRNKTAYGYKWKYKTKI